MLTRNLNITPPPTPLPAKFTPLRVAYGDPNRGAGELEVVVPHT